MKRRTSGHLRVAMYFEGRDPGGTTGVIEPLIRALSRDMHIVLIHSDVSSIREWAESLRSPDIDIAAVALRNYGGWLGWFEISKLLRMALIFRRMDSVHFHLHAPFAGIPAILLARVLSCRCLTTEHYISQIRHLRRRPLPSLLRAIREARIAVQMLSKRLSVRAIESIVAVSIANGQYITELFGPSVQSKLVVVANGIDVQRFSQADETQGRAALRSFVPAGTSHVVLTVAGFNNQKGHRYLLQAISRVVTIHPDASFVFVGDGHLRPELEALASLLEIRSRVVFVGHRNDVPDLLAGTDLFVLPSLFEGMPLSVLEAMAANKAVVATNVDGTSEIVVNGETGILVQPGNAGSLAEAISAMLGDKQLREQFGKAGGDRVRKLYTSQVMIAGYQSLYDMVAKTILGVPG